MPEAPTLIVCGVPNVKSASPASTPEVLIWIWVGEPPADAVIAAVVCAVTSPFALVVTTQTWPASPQEPGPEFTVARVRAVAPAEVVASPVKAGIHPGRIWPPEFACGTAFAAGVFDTARPVVSVLFELPHWARNPFVTAPGPMTFPAPAGTVQITDPSVPITLTKLPEGQVWDFTPPMVVEVGVGSRAVLTVPLDRLLAFVQSKVAHGPGTTPPIRETTVALWVPVTSPAREPVKPAAVPLVFAALFGMSELTGARKVGVAGPPEAGPAKKSPAAWGVVFKTLARLTPNAVSIALISWLGALMYQESIKRDTLAPALCATAAVLSKPLPSAFGQEALPMVMEVPDTAQTATISASIVSSPFAGTPAPLTNVAVVAPEVIAPERVVWIWSRATRSWLSVTIAPG